MSYNRVRNYTDSELIELASKAEGFKGFPKDYWILAIGPDPYNHNSN